jgi:hypothetical protein
VDFILFSMDIFIQGSSPCGNEESDAQVQLMKIKWHTRVTVTKNKDVIQIGSAWQTAVPQFHAGG